MGKPNIAFEFFLANLILLLSLGAMIKMGDFFHWLKHRKDPMYILHNTPYKKLKKLWKKGKL